MSTGPSVMTFDPIALPLLSALVAKALGLPVVAMVMVVEVRRGVPLVGGQSQQTPLQPGRRKNECQHTKILLIQHAA